MDQVFDALNAESPYDRCANQINSSIMLYKDGKDRGLVGGTSDDEYKEGVVKEFYERLKADLAKHHGTDDNFNIETTGTQVGGYLFNNRNDFVERAGEAFNETIKDAVSWDSILGIIKSFNKQVIARCDALIKVNTDLTKQLSKTEFTKLDIDISDKLKNETSTIKEALTGVDKNDRIIKSINTPEISDISEFLRDSLIATSKVNKKYSLRYVERYKAFKEIISEMITSSDAISKYLDTKKEPLKDLSNSETKILCIFRDILFKISDGDDPFVFKTQAYKADLNTFAISPITLGLEGIEYGCTVSEYLDGMKEDKLYAHDDGKTKQIFTTVRSSDKNGLVIDKLYASDIIGSGKIDFKKSSVMDLDLFKIAGDMSVKDFYTQVQKHIDNIKDKDDLKKSAIECLNIVIDQIKRVRTAAVKLEAISNKDFTNIKSSEMYIVKMLIHFSCEVILDALSTVEGMMSCNMIDNVRKILLINLTNSLIMWFDSTIRSGLGE